MNGSLTIEAVRKTVTVECAVEEAFRVFTAGADSWWPVDTHSIHGERVREIVFEQHVGGDVYEVSEDGDRGHWATVLVWEPPGRLVLAWNILEREPVATELEVRFVAEGSATRVELEHRGWDAVPEAASEKRASYDSGWERVLGCYASGT